MKNISGLVRLNTIDLTGQTSGFLSYVAEAGKAGKERRIKCLCACGKEHLLLAQRFIEGSTKSCGCYASQVSADRMRRVGGDYKRKDLAGLIVGRWTVLHRDPECIAGTPLASQGVRWICRCACGNEKSVLTKVLTRAESKSCGCLRKEITSQRTLTHGRYARYTYNRAAKTVKHDQAAEKSEAEHEIDRNYGVNL